MKEALQLWGGIESTRNRVNELYFDQISRAGHEHRITDLEAFANLGLKTIRYPFLWEKTEDSMNHTHDWRWSDERVARLKDLNLNAIVGFLHHGSGPQHTHLLDPRFPEKLADFAFQFASRYPHFTQYTPVNEPLTTARFSCLYGIWYPHQKSATSFLRALILQCKGVSLSMKKIRQIQPKAELIQTDDLGKTTSTPELEYQASFENERRWLSFDILCGRLDRNHYLWKHLLGNGISEAELDWFLENPCPPDVIGINHYLTSNRFLDHRLSLYPEHLHGGNGVDRYADVEAVRIGGQNFSGLERLLEEAWQRYHLPLAVTEVHLGCTREEQLRWLTEVWTLAKNLHPSITIRAVTAWALLGSFDWNVMCARESNHYEVGVFDLRSSPPRKTVLAHFIEKTSKGETFDHPILDEQGWWHRPCRIAYEIRGDERQTHSRSVFHSHQSHARKLLITGGRGTLATAFAKICDERGLSYLRFSRETLDITDRENIHTTFEQIKPWAVINAAGFVRVDEAENCSEKCFLENATGPALLAEECERRGIPFVTYSSGLVFDGMQNSPYVESSRIAPLSTYGKSKASGEAEALEKCSQSLVIRASTFFGPWDSHNFLTETLNLLSQNQNVLVPSDLHISPTYIPDLVHTSLDLLIDGETGLWHLANQGNLTWFEFAQAGASRAGLKLDHLQQSTFKEMPFIAERPKNSVLGSERGNLMPKFDSSLERYFEEAKWDFLQNRQKKTAYK